LARTLRNFARAFWPRSRLSRGSDPKARVAVFTHGLPINVVLSPALRLEGIIHFLPGYGSVTRLRARDGGAIGVVSINESGHHAWPETNREPGRKGHG
jgi:broad specificity phosphatase PhoE